MAHIILQSRRQTQSTASTNNQANEPALSNIQKLYAAGGVLDVFSIATGAMGKASAIRARGKFEEASFRENSRRLKLAVADALKRGQKDVANFMKSIRKFEGSQVAAMGAQGIDVSRGSAADVRLETIESGIEDSSTIRTNAYREAFGFRQEAIEQESKARLTRIARKAQEKQVKRQAIAQISKSFFSTATSIGQAGGA